MWKWYVTIDIITTIMLQAYAARLELVKFWADEIGNKLYNFSEESTGVQHIKQEYSALNMDIEKISGEKLAKNLSEELGKFFGGKKEALQKPELRIKFSASWWSVQATKYGKLSLQVKVLYNLFFSPSNEVWQVVVASKSPVQSVLQNLAKNASVEEHAYRPDQQELHYFNGKDLRGLNLTFDPSFGVPVNFNASIVHIPTEVYDRAPEVARDIKWTKSLNKVFEKNFEEYPGLSWQYFGSAEGIHRQYPGRKWPVNSPDLYDARRRPWYIQGAASPKDVVILIDRSGSSIGVRIEIARFAATVIIETLTTNDFFHVVTFNNESKFICCDEEYRLMQATRGNKEYVKGRLGSMTAKDTADWDAGIKMALSILKKTWEEEEGSRCQQVLIVLSDGSSSYNQDLFKKFDPENKIRVFTYVVGPKQYSVEEMQEMACNHKGYFMRIASLGAVWQTVTSYIRVLSRPLGLQEEKQTTFTSVFVDATGSGLVSTGSIPVFKNSSKELLGVMATDVPVKDLSEFIFYPLIGHNGYVYAIDNNGLILIHPGIDEKKLTKLNPQPNMDFDELEFAVHNQSRIHELRNKMILVQTGQLENDSIEVYTKFANELRVRRDNMQYFYVRPEASPFSIGIVSPQYGIIIKSSKIQSSEGIQALKNVTRIKRWAYCSKTRMVKNITQAIIEKLNSSSLRKNCESNMWNGLLVDAFATKKLQAQWKTSFFKNDDVNALHIRTHFGVIHSLTKNNQTLPRAEQISKEQEEDLSVKPWDFYGRAVQQPNKITVSVLLNGEIKNSKEHLPHHVSIHYPVHLEKENVTMAVTGIEMNYAKFRDKYFIQQTECKNEENCEETINCNRSQENQGQGLYCYLLDENGFVVASNEDDESGQFFGEIDSSVMSQLIKKNENYSLYDVVILPDYQASCKLYMKAEGSSAARLLDPLRAVLSSVFTATLQLLTMVSRTVLYKIWAGLTAATDRGHSIEEDDFIYVSCKKNTTIYLAHTDNILATGNATCGPTEGCSKGFVISSINRTNLYLLTVNSSCGKCKQSKPGDLPGIPGKYKEIVFRGVGSYTKPPEREKVRRKPSKCYRTDKENNEKCGAPSTGSRKTVSLMTFHLAIWMMGDTIFL